MYLEAGVMGMLIYEKMGFPQVSELVELNLRPFGLQIAFAMAKMAFLQVVEKTSDETPYEC